jgi:hypothetical protein
MSSFSLTGAKWGAGQFGTSGGQVTWSFATTSGQFFQFDAPISQPEYQRLVRDAFDAWEAVANIDFVETSDSPASNIRLGWDAIDGKWNTLGEEYGTWGGGDEIGSAIHAEIRFDTAEAFSLSKTVQDASNFYALAVHEIGHALGLAHSEDMESIMFPILGHAVTLAAGDIAGAELLYGAADVDAAPTGDQLIADVKLIAATYQFFAGWVPLAEGFEYLIDCDENPCDLNDPYYAQFNQENRYINFASNLGTEGVGAATFEQKYGALSFEQTVKAAYREVMGTELTGGALDFFLHGVDFYEEVAKARVVRADVGLDEATKIVAIGSILNEATKAGSGPYGEAISAMVSDLVSDGVSALLGQDLFAVA